MKAVYDLAWNSPTWDFVIALATMEIERIRRGEDDLELIFAPGPVKGFREHTTPPVEPELRERMFANVVLPVTRMLPSVVQVERATKRSGLEKHFGFGKPLVGINKQVEALISPSGRCFVCPGERGPGPGLVTITLREAPYHPGRNSNTGSWLVVAEHLKERGHRVVFLRDGWKIPEPLDGFEIAPDASAHALIRATLYRRAMLNIMITHGPVALPLFANLPLLDVWKWDGRHGASSLASYTNAGMHEGGQWPLSCYWQRRIWCGDDDPKPIITAAEQLLADLEAV